MEFHLYLANHHPHSFVLLEDVVRPVIAGLEDAGHRVVAFSNDIVLAPRINLFVEFFPDPSFVDTLLALKEKLGDRFLFGVLCTEDLGDPVVWKLSGAKRLEGLKRLLPRADFVWTLLSPDSYRSLVAPERLARIDYGFSPRLVPACYIADPAERDLDVLIYGSPYNYRLTIQGALHAAGLSCEFTISASTSGDQANLRGLPRYLADEVLARAKLVIDMRRAPEVRALSIARIGTVVHSGTAIVAESFDEGETAQFYRYTTPAPYDRIAETCVRLIREGGYVALGRAARDRFAAETSMRDNMAAVLQLPVLRKAAAP